MSNALNLREINQSTALDLCQFSILAKQNLLLLGKAGVGKTHIATHSILETGHKVLYLNLSVLDRNDLLGYPSLFEKGDIVQFKSPYYLPFLKKGQTPENILLLDEVDKASTDIQAPLLEILQFKTLNGKPLNLVSCILTGNLPNENAYGNALSTPLLDRCAKYILTFDFQHWYNWAKSHNIHDLILGFLNSNQDLACGKVGDTALASPTPRGWSFASEALIQAHKFKITDLNTLTNLVAGFVGSEAALKFETWLKYTRQFENPILSLIERGILDFDYAGLGLTEKLIFCIGMCYMAKTKIAASSIKKRMTYLDHLCKFMTEYKIPPEMQLASLGNSFNFDFITKYKLFEHKSFFKLIEELQK